MLRNNELYLRLRIELYQTGAGSITYSSPLSQVTKFCIHEHMTPQGFSDLLLVFRADYIKTNNPGIFDFYIFSGPIVRINYTIEWSQDKKITATKKDVVDLHKFLQIMKEIESETFKKMHQIGLSRRL